MVKGLALFKMLLQIQIVGVITSIIVPGNSKLFNMFSGGNDIIIPWQNIKCIGDDVILVELQ